LRRVLLIWPKRIDCPSLKTCGCIRIRHTEVQWPRLRCGSTLNMGGGVVRLLPRKFGTREHGHSHSNPGRHIPADHCSDGVNWFVQMHQRNSRSWEAILARMSPACRLAYTSSAPSEALRRHWAQTPRAAFRDAGALMEMAEYAERNLLGEDPAKLQDIRHAALQLRLASTGAMIRRFSLR